ncbi:MAG TPA: GDSL-type esterase/lipase family protein [Sporichthyaceae bacterium]|jgi:lysophospholipase L1-like esterase
MAGTVTRRLLLMSLVGAAALAGTLATAPSGAASPMDGHSGAPAEGSVSALAPRPALVPGAGRGMAVVGAGSSAPLRPASTYLALGDSITFGYDPTADHTRAANSVGYPGEVASALSHTLVNASCPGETSASFLASGADDQGCHAFRAAAPLHAHYTGTQLDFATDYLRTHPGTDLVSLGIGINDLYRCNRVSTDRCAGELTATLETYRFDLSTIVRALRAVYAGPLVLVDYYSPNYQDFRMTDAVGRLNAIVAEVARTNQSAVAHTDDVFAGPNPTNARDICAAGLLIKLTHRCDIHPSPSGRTLLAAAVTRAAESAVPARPTLVETSYGAA